MVENPFIGAWRLLSFESRTPDGRVRYPLGKDAVGSIIYTADGRMSVAIMAAERPNFAANDVLGGTTQERAEATRRYLSYAGTYEIGDGEIIHHVEISLFPNWVGDAQRRAFALEGDRLTLCAVQMTLAGVESRNYLVWERMAPAR